MSRYTKPLLDLDGTVHHDNGDWIEEGTIFVEEDLGIPNRSSMSAIYLPHAFRNDDQVDVLLYLHGITTQPSIQAYLHTYRLREIVQASGKNVVFIAPTLGKNAEPGSLVTSGGALTYLNNLMASLRTYGPYPSDSSPPTIRTIVLAAHSGGGYSMLKIAYDLKGSGLNSECWGFDCLYVPGKEKPLAAPAPWTFNDPGNPVADDLDSWLLDVKTKPEGMWVDWCRFGNSLRLFWGNGSTLTRTANMHLYALQAPTVASVQVEPPFYDAYPTITKKRLMPVAVASHDAVPKTVLGKCLAGARTLS